MNVTVRSFPAASMQDLRELTAFVAAGCEEAGASAEAAGDVRLAVEEAFTNILGHGYGGEPGPLTLSVRAEDGRIAIVIEDRAPIFDPAAAPPADLLSDWDERDVGGLGWHLIHAVMDEVRHEPLGAEGNRLTLVRRLGDAGGDAAPAAG